MISSRGKEPDCSVFISETGFAGDPIRCGRKLLPAAIAAVLHPHTALCGPNANQIIYCVHIQITCCDFGCRAFQFYPERRIGVSVIDSLKSGLAVYNNSITVFIMEPIIESVPTGITMDLISVWLT